MSRSSEERQFGLYLLFLLGLAFLLAGCGCTTEAALAKTHAKNAADVEVLTLELLDASDKSEGQKQAAKALLTTNTRGAQQLADALNASE